MNDLAVRIAVSVTIVVLSVCSYLTGYWQGQREIIEKRRSVPTGQEASDG